MRVYDLGIFTEQAMAVAKAVGECEYFTPWTEAFPDMPKSRIGDGLPGLKRIKHFFKDLDKVDWVYVTDTYCGDIVCDCRKTGIPVAGAGIPATDLESKRWETRALQAEGNFPTQETHQIFGITNLRKWGQDKKNYIIKIDEYRGLAESFKWYDYKRVKNKLDRIAWKAGPYADKIPFIAEEMLKGIEPGWDGITFNGADLYPTLVGYEQKGSGYISRTYESEKDVPLSLRTMTDILRPTFKANGTRMFYSIEGIIDKQGIPFMIDPTIRHAAPGTSALQTEIIENFAEVVAGLAFNVQIDPKIRYKYGAAVCFDSEEANENWLCLDIPKNLKDRCKLRMAVRVDGDYYAVPGFDSIVTVVGMSNSIKDAVQQVKDVRKEIYAMGLSDDMSGLDDIVKDIEEGKKFGVNF